MFRKLKVGSGMHMRDGEIRRVCLRVWCSASQLGPEISHASSMSGGSGDTSLRAGERVLIDGPFLPECDASPVSIVSFS